MRSILTLYALQIVLRIRVHLLDAKGLQPLVSQLMLSYVVSQLMLKLWFNDYTIHVPKLTNCNTTMTIRGRCLSKIVSEILCQQMERF